MKSTVENEMQTQINIHREELITVINLLNNNLIYIEFALDRTDRFISFYKSIYYK